MPRAFVWRDGTPGPLRARNQQQLPGSLQILHVTSVIPLVRRPPVAVDLRLLSHSMRRKKMLWALCVVLLILWALGLATSYTAGGLIHILLVVALIVMVFRLIQGRRVV